MITTTLSIGVILPLNFQADIYKVLYTPSPYPSLQLKRPKEYLQVQGEVLYCEQRETAFFVHQENSYIDLKSLKDLKENITFVEIIHPWLNLIPAFSGRSTRQLHWIWPHNAQQPRENAHTKLCILRGLTTKRG